MLTIDDKELLYNMTDGSYEYQDRPFSGVARRYSRHGTLLSEIVYVNGLQDGPARYWYPSGELMGEESFRRNGRSGVSREWHRNGKVKRETEFEHSIRVREKQWDESGQIVRDFTLSKDDPLYKTLEQYRRIYDRP